MPRWALYRGIWDLSVCVATLAAPRNRQGCVTSEDIIVAFTDQFQRVQDAPRTRQSSVPH
jgi:hypothetical protein